MKLEFWTLSTVAVLWLSDVVLFFLVPNFNFHFVFVFDIFKAIYRFNILKYDKPTIKLIINNSNSNEFKSFSDNLNLEQVFVA